MESHKKKSKPPTRNKSVDRLKPPKQIWDVSRADNFMDFHGLTLGFITLRYLSMMPFGTGQLLGDCCQVHMVNNDYYMVNDGQ